jgi:type III restriction enzyme
MIQKGSQRIEIKNGDNEPYVNTIRAFVSQEEFQEIYFGLSSNLTKRTLYKCNVDKDKFVSGCIEEINTYLQYFKVNKAVNIATGKAGFNDAQMFEMVKSGDKTFDIDVGMKVIPKSDFEVVNYIMHHTMLPRLAIFNMLAVSLVRY